MRKITNPLKKTAITLDNSGRLALFNQAIYSGRLSELIAATRNNRVFWQPIRIALYQRPQQYVHALISLQNIETLNQIENANAIGNNILLHFFHHAMINHSALMHITIISLVQRIDNQNSQAFIILLSYIYTHDDFLNHLPIKADHQYDTNGDEPLYIPYIEEVIATCAASSNTNNWNAAVQEFITKIIELTVNEGEEEECNPIDYLLFDIIMHLAVFSLCPALFIAFCETPYMKTQLDNPDIHRLLDVLEAYDHTDGLVITQHHVIIISYIISRPVITYLIKCDSDTCQSVQGFLTKHPLLWPLNIMLPNRDDAQQDDQCVPNLSR
jgi:hypothetical protein